MAAIVETDFAEQPFRSRRRVATPGDLHRDQDVLVRGQGRHKVKELEHEPDLLAAQPGKRIFAQLCDVHVVNEDLAGRRRIQPRDEAEEGRLATAGWAENGEKPTGGDRQVQRMENRERTSTARDGLRDAPKLNHRSCLRSIGLSACHRLASTMRAPAGLGCMPSAMFRLGLPATPSR